MLLEGLRPAGLRRPKVKWEEKGDLTYPSSAQTLEGKKRTPAIPTALCEGTAQEAAGLRDETPNSDLWPLMRGPRYS